MRYIVKVILLATIIITVAALTSKAQKNSLRVQQFTTKNGLNQDNVQCLFQDNLGFLWFGTNGGLNKYDGKKFISFKNRLNDPNSLSHNKINSIYQDSYGILWILTAGGGLNEFDPKSERFTRYMSDPKNRNSISSNDLISIVEDKNGNLWIGADNGVNKFDRTTKSFSYYRIPDDNKFVSTNSVSLLKKDSKGKIYACFWAGGIEELDINTGKFSRIFPLDNDKFGKINVSSIYEDDSSNFWVGTYKDGMIEIKENGDRNYFAPQQNNPNALNSLEIQSIEVDNHGDLLILTSDGLQIFDKDNFTFLNDRRNQILSKKSIGQFLLKDKTGSLWIATQKEGVYKLDPTLKNFQNFLSNVEQDENFNNIPTRSFKEDKDKTIWVGTFGAGLLKFDRKQNSYTAFVHDENDKESISGNYISGIIRDKSGTLWVSTNDGLNKFDEVKNQFRCIRFKKPLSADYNENDIWFMMGGDGDVIWIGGAFGLKKFNTHNEQEVNYNNDPNNPKSLSKDKVTFIFEDSKGLIWIGTKGGGLNMFDSGSETFVSFVHSLTDKNSLINNFVNSIVEDKNGVLWIGTDAGLSEFDPTTNVFKNYWQENNLETICAILDDDTGYLWMSEYSGKV